MPSIPDDGSVHRIMLGTRPIGYVAVATTIAGRAHGGLRIASDLSEQEIRCAAHAMTLKYGLLGLPQGGAKAGIIGDADAPLDEKRRLLHEFARATEPWLRARTYIPDADIGTSAPAIRWMMESIGMRVGRREWQANSSGAYTARSCLASALAVLDAIGLRLRECRVAIEGFGHVGSVLALLLHERGARVVAVSTSRGALFRPGGLDVERLVARAADAGSRFVEHEPDRIDRAALLELPVDLLLPCARFHSIHAGNVMRVSVPAICAGANDPVSPEAERVLFERGVLYPPDFLSNCGGVLGGTLEFAGVPAVRIGALIEACVRRKVSELLNRAGRLGVTPRTLAEAEALERHAIVRRQTERPGLLQHLFSMGIEGYRRGWIPQKLVSSMAPSYVARRLARAAPHRTPASIRL
jgi:glutamate dehydrogenase (NAD(P)+)